MHKCNFKYKIPLSDGWGLLDQVVGVVVLQGRETADVPGDSDTVGLVSCRGGGGSGVSGDRDWTFDGGAIAGRTGVDVDT